MLNDLIQGIRDAETFKEREKYYKSLQTLGMDRDTVDDIVIEMEIDEQQKKDQYESIMSVENICRKIREDKNNV